MVAKKTAVTKSGKVEVSDPKSRFELEFYVDDDGKQLVLEWLRGLSLTKKQVLGQAMNEILQTLGIDVCATEFGKQLGKGLFEFRLRHKPGDIGAEKGGKKLPPEELLLRVFCHAHGKKLILLLGGYDKGEDTSKKRQDREIGEARARLAKWRSRQAD